MADDNATKPSANWGTIFSGGRETTLGGIEQKKTTIWTEQDEEDYLSRIRGKAAQMAESMLEEARQQAETIRQSAREEGYAHGIQDAQAELESFQHALSESVHGVLNAIEGQCSYIFARWREELVGVARLAVEKVTALELSERNAAVLETLLMQAVKSLETRRSIIIRVNPADEPVLNDIISFTQQKFPDITSWRVRADGSISPGGMVIESESSLAEGRLESRQKAVDEALEHLILPE